MWSQQIRYPVGIEFDPYVFPAGDNGDNLCVTRAGDGVLYTSQSQIRDSLYKDGMEMMLILSEAMKTRKENRII